MNKIDFSEIEDWGGFEDLTAAYFREIRYLEDNHLTEVKVEESGEGPDGGRDIFLTFRVNDSIVPFERKWVVQCKFYEKLHKSKLDKIDIPTLIAENQADGYLLICKNSVTAGVTDTFERLRRNCRHKYCYEVWNGNHFKHRLYKTEELHQHYFPRFFNYRQQKGENINIEEILKK